MITVINYGLGNIHAFLNVFKTLSIPATVAESASDLRSASKLILPGVGAFDHAMELLGKSGMRDTLNNLVLDREIPVLGVCVGMQIMASASDEGVAAGLNWISGRVESLRSAASRKDLCLPHMGWNDVHPLSHNPLFADLESSARFYFLHSYYFACDNEDDVLAVAHYGGRFTCAVKRRNVYGVQFHPEKSHHYGTQLLRNFAQLDRA